MLKVVSKTLYGGGCLPAEGHGVKLSTRLTRHSGIYHSSQANSTFSGMRKTWHFLLPVGFCFLKPGRASVKVGCLHGRSCKMPRRVIYVTFTETKEEVQLDLSNERS